MYTVASLWKIVPGMEAEAENRGRKVREALRHTPGIEFMTAFRCEDGSAFAVISYSDQATYDRIINDPAGPFAKVTAEHNLEETMTWVQSWRGEEMV